MSDSLLDQPRLIRIADRASSGPNPIASSTCDGWTLPDEHAEPDDTAIPARSKPITAVSARNPGTANSVVLGNRGAPAETIIPSSGLMCRNPASSRVRNPSILAMSSAIAGMATAAAAPKPAIPIRFSVPARRPSSWLPPAAAARARTASGSGPAPRRPSGHRSCAQTATQDRRRVP